MRRFAALLLVFAGCTKTVTLAPTQLPRLQALALREDVEVADVDGDAVRIHRDTRLTLHVPGYPPIGARPEQLGFSAGSLRLGNPLDPRTPTLAYSQIQRVDARVRDMVRTMLAIFIPVGAVLTVIVLCNLDGDADCSTE